MQLAYLNLGSWSMADIRATLAAVLALAVLEATVLANVFAPSSVVAGCSVAIVARYLHQCGNSIVCGAWRARIAVATTLLLTIIFTGCIGILAFGR